MSNRSANIDLPFAAGEKCVTGICEYEFDIVGPDGRMAEHAAERNGRRRIMMSCEPHVYSVVKVDPSNPRATLVPRGAYDHELWQFVDRVVEDFIVGMQSLRLFLISLAVFVFTL